MCITLVVCSAPIYPPDVVLACLVVVQRWTHDSERGCREIRYSPCGQGEDGFNVFADLETCESTCGPPRTSQFQEIVNHVLVFNVLSL